MPRLFSRIIHLKLEGEIYDNETTPESIIKNYDWKFRDFDDIHLGNKLFIELHHSKDSRGRITSITKIPGILKCKKPDTEYFII